MNIKEKIEYAIKLGYTINKEGFVINPSGVLVKGNVDNNYLQFSVRIEKKVIKIRHHKFQAYFKEGDKIFVGKVLVRHLNGNSLDNSWSNIVIGSQRDNMLDRPVEDRQAHSKNAKKLSEIEKDIIYQDKLVNNLSYRVLSKKYSVPVSTIKDFINKKSKINLEVSKTISTFVPTTRNC